MTNELPGMWDKSDLTGGQTDCDRETQEKMRDEFEAAMLVRLKTVEPEDDFVDQASAWVGWQASSAQSAETIAKQSDIIAKLELELGSMKSSVGFANNVITTLEEEKRNLIFAVGEHVTYRAEQQETIARLRKLHAMEQDMRIADEKKAAAAQADNARLREALRYADGFIAETDHTLECAQHCGMDNDWNNCCCGKKNVRGIVNSALSQPLDTSPKEKP